MKKSNRKYYLWLNGTLIALVALLALETTFNLLGRKALIENHFGSAKRWLTLAMNRDLLGLVYYKQEQYDDAFNFYKKREDLRGMGWAYYGMGRYDDAEEYFKRVNDQAGLGQVELARGNIDRAKALFSARREPSGMGLTYLADGDFQNAAISFREAQDQLGLGLTYYAKGDMKSALAILSGTQNVRVAGIRRLMEGNWKAAAENFQNAGDRNLYAAAMEAFGNYDQALALFLDNHHYRAAARVLTAMGRYAEAMEMFNQHADHEGLGDLFMHLGSYRDAFDSYVEGNHHVKALTALQRLYDWEGMMRHGNQVLEQFPDHHALRLLLAESARLAGDFSNALLFLEPLRKQAGYQARSKILEARIRLAEGQNATVNSLLQEAIQISGPGLLADTVMSAGNLRDLPLNSPDATQVTALRTQSSLAWLPWAVLLLFVTGGVSGFRTYRTHRFKVHALELEALQLKPRTPPAGTIREAQAIRTPAAVAVVSKVAPLKKTETHAPGTEHPTPVKPKAPPAPATSPGILILQKALERLKVQAALAELIELAGEEANRLTVYGIYLAARAKGVQVQGIKVEFSYLAENPQAVHLVFFSDENFSLLEAIEDDGIVLTNAPEEQEKISREQFYERWNGYVVTLTRL